MKTIQLSTLAISAAVLLASPTPAQVGVETFAGGNPDGWEIWFTNYNYLRATGGNPDEYFELDDFTSGPSTCQFLDITPDRMLGAVTLSHAGNWRAAGVDQASIDVQILQGPLNGILTIILVSDPGTPTDGSDDCVLRYAMPNPGPTTTAWTTLVFPVPAAQTTAPAGWVHDTSAQGCSGQTIDAVWNTVVQDVDEVRFRYDTTPGFCAFTRWIFGIDNVTIGHPLPPGPGTNYCVAVPNSTGAPAAMGASGSSSVAQDDVVLQSTGMPVGAFCYFLTSPMQGFIANPGGSQGNLCLGGGIGRFVGPGQIQATNPSGAASIMLQLSAHPTPGGLVQVAPGETWHFTCWYRDLVGGVPTSNFADGYTIVFS